MSTLCTNNAFPQNFHTKELGEITAFYVVNDRKPLFFRSFHGGMEMEHRAKMGGTLREIRYY